MADTIREIVDEVLTPNVVKSVWSVNYPEALPPTLQDFSVGALLPAVLYMFRWGHRRGQGKFRDAFASDRATKPTIEHVAETLSGRQQWFAGFTDGTDKAILGDLLLAFCLENVRHSTGRNQQVQRVYPTHYFASWVNLPASIANLRYVPEMLVALLAQQQSGDVLERDRQKRTYFPVGANHRENLLLNIFGPGVSIRASEADLVGDQFDERVPVGLDQLLTIRVAQACGEARQKLIPGRSTALTADRGRPHIPNQHAIAKCAARDCYDDLRVFLETYGHSAPRQSLLPMLESAIALGLSNILLSTARLLLDWEQSGRLLGMNEQAPWPVLVDCSCGSDRELRRLSEESMDDCVRRYRRIAVILMCLRVVGNKMRFDRKMSALQAPVTFPDASEWINLVGDVVHERHQYSERILDALHEQCLALAERLEQAGLDSAVVKLLKSGSSNAAWRLAEALTLLMGDKLQSTHLLRFLDSCLMVDEHNGLAMKRRIRLRHISKGRQSGEMRSIVLTNTALDFLVHRHLWRDGRRQHNTLALDDFIDVLRDSYGFHVDTAPPGMSISKEILLSNRRVLERRLRDIGVLVGVNDAESMKRLRPRFAARKTDHVLDTNTYSPSC